MRDIGKFIPLKDSWHSFYIDAENINALQKVKENSDWWRVIIYFKNGTEKIVLNFTSEPSLDDLGSELGLNKSNQEVVS